MRCAQTEFKLLSDDCCVDDQCSYSCNRMRSGSNI